MKRSIAFLFAALAALPCLAANDIDVCATVPVADVEAALGVKIDRTTKGLRECRWNSMSRGVLAMANSTDAIKDPKVNTKGLAEMMKQQGWNPTVTDDTATLWCVQASTGGQPMGQCNATGKGRELHVTAHGPGMTAAKAKALVSRVIARLP